ncbi:uncharacterized protein CLUP02_02318 [Colletotrichum lupini]|uniref:Uncharacterized protein n=1 Tax=Colletotrichum lupini TaxID=145971 RepID=A0A9Q8SFQ6_9PEZI|nr:uncharacterized protein CLUP02_02318 [Colletotrichum lupini]UQC75662.1 hypothetical protein CLUP02_02318 [Colletotrichum lupini]
MQSKQKPRPTPEWLRVFLLSLVSSFVSSLILLSFTVQFRGVGRDGKDGTDTWTIVDCRQEKLPVTNVWGRITRPPPYNIMTESLAPSHV